MRRRLFLLLALLLLTAAGAWWWSGGHEAHTSAPRKAGTPLDSLHGVVVYDNAGMGNVSGRNVVDGYNVGLRYQCVEFVKRYYLERYDHRMPNSYGHAKDLFDRTVADGAVNEDRGLVQFTNPSSAMPIAGDLVVLDGWPGNPYGHVAIVSKVADGEVEIVQQNTGSTRGTYDLDHMDGKWRIDSKRVLGWLRVRPGS
jgi:surface antigen